MSEKMKKLMYLEKKSSVDIYNHLFEKEKEECDNIPRFEEKFKIKDLIKISPSDMVKSPSTNTKFNSQITQNYILHDRESYEMQHNPAFNQSVVIHESIGDQELDLNDYKEDICTFNPKYRLENNNLNENSNLVSVNAEKEDNIDDLNMSLQYLKNENQFVENVNDSENKFQFSQSNSVTEKKRLSIIDYPKIPVNLSQSTFDLSLLNFPVSEKKDNNYKTHFHSQSHQLIQPKLMFLLNIIKKLKEEMIENILSLNNFIDNFSLEMNQINKSTDTTELINNCMNSFEIFNKNINQVTLKYEQELKSVITEHYNRKESFSDYAVSSLNNKTQKNLIKMFQDNKLSNNETNQYNLNISYLNKEILENSHDINHSIYNAKEFNEKLTLQLKERIKEKETECCKLKENMKTQEIFIKSSKGLIEELYKKNNLLKEKLIKYKIRCEGSYCK